MMPREKFEKAMITLIGLSLLILGVILLALIMTPKAEAGILRPGKIFPLWRNRPGYEPNQPNPQPLPSPIIDSTLKPPIIELADSQPVAVVTKGELEEFKKDVLEVFAERIVEIKNKEEPPVESKVPPWLPLGGIAGGGILTLLGFARKGLSQIRGG